MIVLVKSVKLIKNFEVEMEFSTGEKKVVDLDPLLRGPIFEPIRNNPDVFRSMQVDEELGTIVWENGADIDPEVLYGSYVPAWMEDEESVTA